MYNPSDPEEEYFARQEMERRKRDHTELAAKMADEEKKRLKDLHFMRCPKCGMELHNYEFRGITLDRCSGCGGVFFDDGEMEQMLSKGGDFATKFRKLFS